MAFRRKLAHRHDGLRRRADDVDLRSYPARMRAVERRSTRVGGGRLIAGRGSAWLERLVRDQEVAGSNPVAPTHKARNDKGFRRQSWKPFFVGGASNLFGNLPGFFRARGPFSGSSSALANRLPPTIRGEGQALAARRRRLATAPVQKSSVTGRPSARRLYGRFCRSRASRFSMPIAW
jgi:hypothetical protein